MNLSAANRESSKKLRLFTLLVILPVVFLLLFKCGYAGGKWYNYYENGVKYMKQGKYQRAINEFKSAISLEFADKKRMRTYGMHFIKYYPHRYLAEAYYYLGDLESAKKEVDLSLAFQSSKEAKKLQSKILGGEAPPLEVSPEEAKLREQEQLALAQERQRLEKEKELLAEKEREEREKALKELEDRERKLAEREAKLEEAPFYLYMTSDLPTGALTYDPGKVAQVGSRLSIAVLKFSFSGPGRDLSDDILNELITRLYSLRRFDILEREKYDKVVQEQLRGQAGQIDEATAAQAGKLMGVDAALTGSIAIGEDGSLKIWGRLVNTETGKLVTAQDAYASASDLTGIRTASTDLAVKIYNDLPLVEGYVMDVEGDNLVLDLGSEKHMKRDMQCVVYREGEDIKHPISGEILDKKKIYLGEVVLTQVQERSSLSNLIIKEEKSKISVGDKVVVK
ncbi:MAG: CsgG/HfaB family protein [Candidatus Zixiibacteriota bacterium]